MSDFHTIYKASLKDARANLAKKVNDNSRCYEGLKNKDSQYAKVVKALGDLHLEAYNIYKNAPDEIL